MSEMITMSSLKQKKVKRIHAPSQMIRMGEIPQGKSRPAYSFTISNNLSLHTILRDGEWEGSRCFIIGGGLSAKGFDFSRIKGERVIACNKSFVGIDPDIIIGIDSRVWSWIESGQLGEETKQIFNKSKAIKAWARMDSTPLPDLIYRFDSLGHRDLSTSIRNGLPCGSDTGLAALNLAILLKANPIYLIGYDMGGENGKQAWWHGGYPSQNPDDDVYKNYLGHYAEVIDQIKATRARIINLNPNSRLKHFEFGNIDEIITKG